MKCTLVYELYEYYENNIPSGAWDNNYICVPPTSPINFVWESHTYGLGSYLDLVYGQTCTRWWEPTEPASESWDDNYLCYYY